MTDKFQNKYRVASARAAWWDYGKNGIYFITIITKARKHYFGKIENRKMELSEIGKQVQNNWMEIPMHFSFVFLDEFIVMPDHLHGIIIIDGSVGIETGHALSLPQPQPQPQPQPKLITAVKNQFHPRYQNQGKNTISAMVGSFKSSITKWCNENELKFGWQTRFHDHIIRDESELNRVRNYIIRNPENWKG